MLKLVYPDYYEEFQCIADRCKHNCCIGWEIDIDQDTLSDYLSLDGALGERLRDSIETTDQSASFRLDENRRCPFLNSSNLCDLILELGPNSICSICTEHPRFYNEFSSRREVGLGLCCEAAAFLIIGKDSPMKLCGDEPDENDTKEEQAFFKFRNKVFSILQNRDLKIKDRLALLCNRFGCSVNIDIPDWIDFYRGLERLDVEWDEFLQLLENNPSAEFPSLFEQAFEQIAVYFAYRHLAQAENDGLLLERIKFIVHAVDFIGRIFAASSNHSLSNLSNIARCYSSEIEYSDANLALLLEQL